MTNTELAILGLVVEKPRHGYEIEQVIEERGMRNWTEVGFSSIYYLLNKLEGQGWVESRLEEAGRGPARKVYAALPAGRQALHHAVLETLSVPQRWFSPLLLGLSHLPAIPRNEALAALCQYRSGLLDRKAQVQAEWDRQRPVPRHVELMFEYSLALIGAELAWLESLIAELDDAGVHA